MVIVSIVDLFFHVLPIRFSAPFRQDALKFHQAARRSWHRIVQADLQQGVDDRQLLLIVEVAQFLSAHCFQKGTKATPMFYPFLVGRLLVSIHL